MRVYKKIEYLEAVQWHPGVEIKGVTVHNYGTKQDPKFQGWIRGRMNKTSPVNDGDWVLATEFGALEVVTDQVFEAEYDAVRENALSEDGPSAELP